MRPHHGSAALALSDLGDSRCGVGNSVARLLAQADLEQPVVVDLAERWTAFRRTARSAAAATDLVVVVYPTRSTVRRPSTLLRVAALRWWFRRGRLRAYLHEFGRLGRRHRAFVAAGLLTVDDRVVVCVPSEVGAVRSTQRLLHRDREVVAVPSINGTAPSAEDVEAAFIAGATAGAARHRTVGVFGSHRPDKAPEWLEAVLAALDPRFDRVELVGAGWDSWAVPAAVRGRYEFVVRGHLPDAELPTTLGAWGLAIAPFWAGGTHDGRGSLRTPLALGVTTLTRPPMAGDLTLDVPHLRFVAEPDQASEVPDLPVDVRRRGAEEVAAFEREAVRRTAAALFGDGS